MNQYICEGSFIQRVMYYLFKVKTKEGIVGKCSKIAYKINYLGIFLSHKYNVITLD
jgi:hypothetical protein